MAASSAGEAGVGLAFGSAGDPWSGFIGGSEAHHAVAHGHAGGGAVVVGVHPKVACAVAVTGIAAGAVQHHVAAVGRAVAVGRERIGAGWSRGTHEGKGGGDQAEDGGTHGLRRLGRLWPPVHLLLVLAPQG